MNRSKLSEFERAWWAATKLQARYRGRVSRNATKAKPIARLKAKMNLGLLVMSRIADFATTRSSDFIKELEEESLGHHSRTILREAHGDDAIRADEIETTKYILQGKTLDEINKEKKQAKKQELEGYEMKEDHDADYTDTFDKDDANSSEVGKNGKNLFVKSFPVYPKLVLSFQAHNDNYDYKSNVIVQKCWCEVPQIDKPMKMLKVRQDQLDDALRPVTRHTKGEQSSSASALEQEQMSEGGFSSQSSLGDSDDLGDLYESEEDLELSTNLHDLA